MQFTIIRQLSRFKISPMSLNNYEDSVKKLNELISNAKTIANSVEKGPEIKLQHIPRTQRFCERAGVKITEINKLKIIHVAGTKGKGSTSTFIDAILRQHGFKTGLFTSPHLMEVRERIKVNGSPISKSFFSHHFWHIYDNLLTYKVSNDDMPFYFQFLTVMAFHIFLEEQVDYVILETGIGGRFDSTNIISNTKVACITSLGFDHMDILGHTMKEIAWNKAGIIKPNCVVVTCDNQPQEGMDAILEEATIHNNTIYIVPTQNAENIAKFDKNLHPENAVLAAAVCGILLDGPEPSYINHIKIDDLSKRTHNIVHLPFQFCTREEYLKIIYSTEMLGRYQIIKKGSVEFFIDGAHTVESMMTCVDWFKWATLNTKSTRRFLVFMVTGPRSVEGLLSLLEPLEFDGILLTPLVPFRHNQPHDFAANDAIIAKEKDKLAEIGATWCRINLKCNNTKQLIEYFNCFEDIDDWLSNKGEHVHVLVTGSLHLVGCALAVIGNKDSN